jgi:predicted MFS family arabinose efflux permease
VSDVGLIFRIQAIRAALYGFGSILIGASLAQSGLDAAAVGLVFTAMLLGMALTSLLVGRWADRFGRRRTYAFLLALMAVAGTVFALTDALPLLILVALTGCLSTDPNESGPITTLEQAMLAGTPASERTRVYGRYNALAYLAGAVGALLAGGPSGLRDLIPALPPDQRWLLVIPVGAVACVVLASRLSSSEVAPSRSPAEPPRNGLDQSRGSVLRLASLFALDAFAGGFVVQTFIVFWFTRQFGVTTDVMGLAFFGVGLLQAGSSIAAGQVAARIGLLNTMVFTHLPSNVFLAAIPVAPALPLAILLLLARSALSQMDVPTRQAYIAALVDPAERTAASAYTNASRYVARPAGPALASVAMTSGVALPFVIAGGLKIVYDLLLLRIFSRVELPEGEA